MTGIVECSQLSFAYKTRQKPSISEINLQIDAGDFILCTGPTGCGKSTLLKAFNGLIPHEIGGTLCGSVRVNGLDSLQSSVAELSRTVGLMFQNPDDQIFSTTVADEVGFALENMGMEREMVRLRVAETLSWVGLPGRELSAYMPCPAARGNDWRWRLFWPFDRRYWRWTNRSARWTRAERWSCYGYCRS